MIERFVPAMEIGVSHITRLVAPQAVGCKRISGKHQVDAKCGQEHAARMLGLSLMEKLKVL